MSGTHGKKNLAYRISFAIIRLFHDNFLLRFFIDPVTLLHDLGLDRGDKVLEVGCGPGQNRSADQLLKAAGISPGI